MDSPGLTPGRVKVWEPFVTWTYLLKQNSKIDRVICTGVLTVQTAHNKPTAGLTTVALVII